MSTVLVSGAELTEQDVAKGTADWLTRSLVPSPFLEHEPRTMLADIPSATKPLFRSIPRRISRGKSLTSFRSKPMRLSSHAASLPRPRVPPSQITGAASTQDLGIELDATEASLPTRLPACLPCSAGRRLRKGAWPVAGDLLANHAAKTQQSANNTRPPSLRCCRLPWPRLERFLVIFYFSASFFFVCLFLNTVCAEDFQTTDLYICIYYI